MGPVALPGLPFSVTHAGSGRVGTSWSKPRFSFPHHRLYWVRGGEAWLGSGRKTGNRLTPGHLYLIPAFAHTESRCERLLDHAWINFTGHPGSLGEAFATGFSFRQRKENDARSVDAGFTKIRKFWSLRQSGARVDAHAGLIASAAFLSLLADFYHGVESTSGQIPARFREFLEHMDSHLADAVNIPLWADRAGLDPVYFANAFSASLGIPPHQWLLRRRLEKAQEMLWQEAVGREEFAVRQVAFAVGFQDESYFSRLFKKKVGLSPRAYRARKREHVQ